MKKLIIFDLDGTLLNTIADLAQSTNHALSLCLIMTCTMLIKAALTPASPNYWNSCRRKG